MNKLQWSKVVTDMSKILTMKQCDSWRKGSDKSKRELKPTMRQNISGNLLEMLLRSGRPPTYKCEDVGSTIVFLYGDVRCDTYLPPQCVPG